MKDTWEFTIKILNLLDIDDRMAQNTRESVKLIHNDYGKARALLKNLDKRESGGNCFECGNRFYCAIFRACIYYDLNELDNALTQIEKSTRDFELSGSIWNETIAMWLYGELLIKKKKETRARAMLGETVKNFIYLARKFRNFDDYTRYKISNNAIEEISLRLKNLQITLPPTEQSKRKEKEAIQEAFQKHYKKQLWKPSSIIFKVHSQITAGREGNFVFDSDASLDGNIDEITFSNTPHLVYNTVKEGLPVIFNPKVHRWFHVNGDSMNLATPIPIEDKDYVLAIDTVNSNQAPQFGDIIVAEVHSPEADERAGVVKKLTKNGLESMSTKPFDPIPYKKIKPRGIVIAVAKPSKISSDELMMLELEKALHPPVNPTIEKLFKNLLAKNLHDQETVVRLILFEKNKTPNLSLEELMQRAINRWIRDNR